MPEVLVRVGSTSHWDAVLPLIPWLEEAGVGVLVAFSGLRPPKSELAWLARSMDLPEPKVTWTRALRGARGRLVLTSTDDLTAGLIDEPAGFVALPRLPVPVTVFPAHPPDAVRVALDALAHSRNTTLIEAGHRHRLLDLPEHLGGLPHSLTGVPLLDGRSGLLDQKTVVVLTGDGAWTAPRATRAVRKQAELQLERVLQPLLDSDLALEVHVLDARPASNTCDSLSQALASISQRAGMASDRLRVRARPFWRALPSAVAVLATSYGSFACAIAAGASRVWWLQLASHPTQTQADRAQRFDNHILHDHESYLDWIDCEGWREVSDQTEAVSELALELHDGNATQRVAQLVLAAVTR